MVDTWVATKRVARSASSGVSEVLQEAVEFVKGGGSGSDGRARLSHPNEWPMELETS